MLNASDAFSGTARASRFAGEWRQSLNILRLALVPGSPNLPLRSEALTADKSPEVRLELEVCGARVGEWQVTPAEIQLPIQLEDLEPATGDALTRCRRLLQRASPADLLATAVSEFQDRSSRVRLPALERLLSVADAFTSAAGTLEEHLVGDDGLVARALEEAQKAAEERGAPVKPEDLRALRHAPRLLLELLANGASRSLGLVERVFDSVTEERADQLRRLLPYGRLPRGICRQIASHLRTPAAKISALWIEFEQPAGYLPILPWERLLASATSMPILRLPYHSHEPRGSDRCENILLFYASPSWNSVPSPQALVDMIEAIGFALRQKPSCRVHLFADARHRPEVEAVLKGRSPPIRVRLVDYPEEPRSNEQGDHWAAWFHTALPDTAIDVIHGLAPAQLVDGQPAILIPNSPWNQDSGAASAVRPVTCPTLVSLADTFGAHTCVLTAFGNQESRAAWRLLADDLAQSRPGTLAYHDFQEDALGVNVQRFAGISSFYASLTRPPLQFNGRSLSVHCHPSQLAAATTEPPEESNMPAWLTITRRRIENMVSAASLGSTPADQAMLAGAAAAMDFVNELAIKTLEAAHEITLDDEERAYLEPSAEDANRRQRKATQ